MKKKLIGLMTVIVITAVLVAGCTSPTSNQTQTSNQSTTAATKTATTAATVNVTTTTAQLPNPAAVFCGTHGGESKIIKSPDGSESGICVLCNGTVCDEWKYFRGECPDS
jgi:putative hemolysin